MYTIEVETALGTIWICGDDKGVTQIKLPRKKNSAIKNEPIESKKIPEHLTQASQQLKEYFKGKRKTFSLPLSINGTIFQCQVWEIIRSIPYGQTMSYGEIARQLGNKGKARAVGGAANANPLPLVIPCHRVVGQNGSLTGFAGGIEMKKTLLNLEKG